MYKKKYFFVEETLQVNDFYLHLLYKKRKLTNTAFTQ